ncbi:MAG: carbon-nitrogen hydrolase family protein [Herminiimonas sp.]|uniref:carbon-nitrogen hydrolase family protein n=1 Tax=Herminiimonas sp. TaxID=1926289 RepID=UPI00272688D3|nr:carbon-nitrogen hydrolase family protein [Herminiimonas sp.]MDO9420058.1 carbon-nitrogen hydrolase family protein [Herminiimonas sp.]
MTTKPFRAAVVQTLATLGDLDINIGLLRSYTEEAVRQGARLVVFPECMNTGYLFDSAEHCAELAEPVNGRFVQAMADLCREYNIFIASGFTEKNEEKNKIFNTGLLLDPKGDIIVHYHKQFLATHDQNWFELGENGCPVVDTELGRIGLLICFDGRIPEITRSLALQGAEIIVDMANFFAMDQADMWVPARAYENGLWFVAATKAGVERSIYYPGGSMIVAPDGNVVAKIPYDTHGVVTAEIDVTRAQNKSWHHEGDRVLDRRPDLYQLIGKPVSETPLAAILDQPLIPEKTVAKAAAVQAHATQELNSLEDAYDMIDHTAKLGVKVIVVPQHFGCSTWLPSLAEAHAEAQHTDAHIKRISAIAKQYGCVIVLPVLEAKSSKISAAAVIIGTDGELLGRYQQTHVEPEMKAWCVPGDLLPVFDTPFGRIGVLLGYDGMFPETSRVLALQGADMIAWCSTWRRPHDRALLTVPKAEDNRIFLIAANRSDCPYPGGSFIVPPNGFPQWNLDLAAPATGRHGAVMPGFMNLALSRQKFMIPKVNMLRNRIVSSYEPITSTTGISTDAVKVAA